MRMRKVFAGIATLATLLGGLAVGAGAAQATPTLGKADVTSTSGAITVINAQEEHTYSAYKIASFSNVKGSNGQVASLDVKTEPKWVDWLNSALTAKKLYASNYSSNPAARLATLSADDASSVINEIKLTSSVTPNATKKNDAGMPTTLKLDHLTDGWYVISDYYNGNQHGSVALVATTITAEDGTVYTKFKLNEAENQTNVQDALGVFYAKNENVPDKPTKTVTKDNKPWEGNSVNVGDTLTYTVWSAISENAVNYKNYGYKIMDRASRGLTVNKASINVVVSDDRDGTNPVPLVLDKDYTVEQTVSNGTDGESRGTTTTVISFTGTVAPNHSGKYVKVTYTATVNADAVNAGKYANLNKTDGTLVSPSQDIAAGTLINRAYVKHDNSSWTDPDERTVYTGAFEFQKYGAAQKDAYGLDGVQFEVYAGKVATGNPLKFTKNDDGSYTYNPDGETTTVASATINGKKGMVSLKGLQGATSSGQKSGDTGVYTIKEIQTVNGYTQQILATFSVKLTVDVNSGASSAELLVAAGNNVLGLASQDSTTAGIRVKNVQNVTQLPLTGAAGITLFAVIAVLFAVVAAILIVKFRSARRELEA